MPTSKDDASHALDIARKRIDALAQSLEARRLPGIVGALSALLEAVEGIAADRDVER
jgi:hypothetical protein